VGLGEGAAVSESRLIEKASYDVVVRVCGALAADDFGGRPKPHREVDAVTLDTNLLHDYWKDRPRKWAIERLVELAAAGTIDLVVTRYVHDDVPASPLRDRIAELPKLQIGMTGGLFTLDVSPLGGSDFFGSDAFLKCQSALATWRPSSRKPPDGRDWNHLHAHYAKRRDFFLTWDEPLLELGELLQPGFSLGVTRPDAYLQTRGDHVQS
jgi:hypothetical protein